jgi:response regulator RpfG family c-di-GMP phosphodiesterase
MNGSPLNVVAVSNDVLRPELLDMLLVDGSSYDVIVVESIARAYSRVRELRADLIVLFMEIDDEDACRLLSMLHNDRALRGIRVVVCATSPDRAATRRVPDFEERAETQLPAAS